MKNAIPSVTTSLIKNVMNALAGETLVAGEIQQPSWLDGDGRFPVNEILAFQNGLLHLPSFFATGIGLMPPTPRYFSSNCLDMEFDVNAWPPAQWLGFLGQLWPNDPASIRALQELFGYALMPD